MPLTELQIRVAGALATIAGQTDLVLAGGGALVELGLSDRLTRDLDYFSTSSDGVDNARPIVEQALADAGLRVEVERSAPGFVRYVVSSDDDETILDLAYDIRLREPTSTPLGLVLDPDELAADKMLALFGRAEARDFVDVFRLRRRYSWERLRSLAVEKDPGFDPAHFIEALASIDRHDRQEFDVTDDEFRELRLEFSSWTEALSEWLPASDQKVGGSNPSERAEDPDTGHRRRGSP